MAGNIRIYVAIFAFVCSGCSGADHNDSPEVPPHVRVGAGYPDLLSIDLSIGLSTVIEAETGAALLYLPLVHQQIGPAPFGFAARIGAVVKLTDGTPGYAFVDAGVGYLFFGGGSLSSDPPKVSPTRAIIFVLGLGYSLCVSGTQVRVQLFGQPALWEEPPYYDPDDPNAVDLSTFSPGVKLQVGL